MAQLLSFTTDRIPLFANTESDRAPSFGSTTQEQAYAEAMSRWPAHCALAEITQSTEPETELIPSVWKQLNHLQRSCGFDLAGFFSPFPLTSYLVSPPSSYSICVNASDAC